MPKPLEGIRVLDCTRVLAGPYCTMMLGDLGAEIIKVEAPRLGDDSRAFGPFKNGQSLYFLNINRGKKSVSLNLKSERGKALFRSLAAESDVVVENFRPGTMEKLGLGWDELKTVNPRLVYAAISGFGHTGPDAQKPAYDILVQAAGGVMSITGWPGQAPVRVGLSMGDITAAIFGAVGVVTALFQRERTGKGQKVDVSMLDCQLAILENALVRYQVDGVPPGPLGSRHPTITPFQAFKASDAHFVVAAGNDQLFRALCDAIGRPELAADERFATNAERTRRLEDLIPVLEEVFAAAPAARWLEDLERAGVPCAPVNTIDKVMGDRQLRARGMFVEVDDPKAGRVIIPGNPIKMESITESPSRPRPPEIGEHTAQVLSTLLGASAADLERYGAEGAF